MKRETKSGLDCVMSGEGEHEEAVVRHDVLLESIKAEPRDSSAMKTKSFYTLSTFIVLTLFRYCR